MLLFLNLFSPLYKNSNSNIIMNESNNYNVIQGGSLKTWSYFSSNVNKVKVTLESFGRPIDSDIELWNGPSNSPYKFRGILRCDLHPRWSNDGKKIFIDFIKNANRNIGIFKISV